VAVSRRRLRPAPLVLLSRMIPGRMIGLLAFLLFSVWVIGEGDPHALGFWSFVLTLTVIGLLAILFKITDRED
jgi:hypothetical protein